MSKSQTKAAPATDEVEAEAEAPAPRSVVRGTYKARYAERAAAGVRGASALPPKARKRSALDWLAIELGKRVLDDKAKLVVPALEAIYDANGVAHAHYNRTTKGWEGRLRMSGGMALRTIVAEAGVLALPGEADLVPPRSWVAKHTN